MAHLKKHWSGVEVAVWVDCISKIIKLSGTIAVE